MAQSHQLQRQTCHWTQEDDLTVPGARKSRFNMLEKNKVKGSSDWRQKKVWKSCVFDRGQSQKSIMMFDVFDIFLFWIFGFECL